MNTETNPAANNYPPVRAEAGDNMPYEVATAMLTEPKAKLTARMRKTCAAARDTIFPSRTPLTRSKEDGQLYPLDLPALRLPSKYRGYTFAQLLRWSRRCKWLRVVLQRHYLQLESEKADDRLLRAVVLAVSRVEYQMDCISDELCRRKATCDFRRATETEIDPRVRRAEKLLAGIAEVRQPAHY